MYKNKTYINRNPHPNSTNGSMNPGTFICHKDPDKDVADCFRSLPPLQPNKEASAPANQTLYLRFAVANLNMTGLKKMLYVVSTPGSPLYGEQLFKGTGSTHVLTCAN